MSTTKSRSDHHKDLILEAAPNGGWRILIRQLPHEPPAVHGAYSNHADMLEGLSSLLYVERNEAADDAI